MENTSQKAGITMLEIIVVVTVIVIIAAGTFSIFSSFMANTYVDDTAQEIVYTLRKANTNTIARYYDLRWGVYFDDTAKSFTLFAGESYAARNAQHDVATNLPASVTLSQISFNGGGKEVVFRKIAGDTTRYGSLKVQSTGGRERTITINQLGQIEIN
ncbi:hypothetical protein HZA42_02445 [Candidatus Peregrinibacteria bacterium]|nr:hypothetical protein [Candidatus Peregrinibacteria bacterium]